MKFAIAAACLLVAAPAAAASVTVSLHGLLQQAIGASAVGDAFATTFSYDDAAVVALGGNAFEYRYAGPIAVSLSGGYAYAGTLSTGRIIYDATASVLSFNGTNGMPQFSVTFALGRTDPANVAPPTLAELSGLTGTFRFSGVAGTGPDTSPLFFGGTGAANVGGVPEPASWACLILGFGTVGATLRIRRGAAMPA